MKPVPKRASVDGSGGDEEGDLMAVGDQLIPKFSAMSTEEEYLRDHDKAPAGAYGGLRKLSISGGFLQFLEPYVRIMNSARLSGGACSLERTALRLNSR
jgi:hypothetical protein